MNIGRMMSSNRTSVFRGLALFVLAALAGCAAAPSKVRVDRAEGVDMARCQSFGWQPVTQDAASLTEQRVRAAVMRQLEAKGYKQASDKPDCRITYVLGVQERPRQKPRVGVGASGGSGGVGGGIGVSIPVGKRDAFGGTFTLDVIDVAANAQIWSGSLDATFAGAELSEQEADAVVAEILSKLPDGAGR